MSPAERIRLDMEQREWFRRQLERLREQMGKKPVNHIGARTHATGHGTTRWEGNGVVPWGQE